MSARTADLMREQVARAASSDLTHPSNRGWLRRAKRHLWVARFGVYVYAAVGAVVGSSIGVGIGMLLVRWIP